MPDFQSPPSANASASSPGSALLSRADALAAMLDGVTPVPVETLSLGDVFAADTLGRVAAAPVVAGVSQPNADVSAMDGYAVRFADAAEGARLQVIGQAPAGCVFPGPISDNQTVRIFTGGVVPSGADHVVIQEDTVRDGDWVTITNAQAKPRHIRRAGLDFATGDALVPAGAVLGPAQWAAAAAGNVGSVSVYRRPKVALLANGDELRVPGVGDVQIGDTLSSSPYALAGLVRAWGAEPLSLGIAEDSLGDIRRRIRDGVAAGADVIVPIGGASVGDHDHMKEAFAAEGAQRVFSKIALRPGKPTWCAQWPTSAGSDGTRPCVVLGLPGNPASALVCAQLFLKPLLYALTGRDGRSAITWGAATLTQDVGPNGPRETFVRAKVGQNQAGQMHIAPEGGQDSAMVTPFLSANALLHRPIGDEPRPAGTVVPYVDLMAN